MKDSYDIFISYRRKDDYGRISGRDQARIIADKLHNRWHLKVFYDYEIIKDGDFEKLILPAIKSCKVFILFLTKGALNRCINDYDWVRREIETAIESQCKIVNVTPDYTFKGKDFPDDLPKTISEIKKIHISNIDFEQLLEASIEKLVKERILPRNTTTTNGFISAEQFNVMVNTLIDYLGKFGDPIEREKCRNNAIIGLAQYNYSSDLESAMCYNSYKLN